MKFRKLGSSWRVYKENETLRPESRLLFSNSLFTFCFHVQFLNAIDYWGYAKHAAIIIPLERITSSRLLVLFIFDNIYDRFYRFI